MKLAKPQSLPGKLPDGEQAFLALWAALERAEKAMPPTQFFRCVIFGGARFADDSLVCRDAEKAGMEIAGHGIDVVTGGGPSVMAAANRGAYGEIKNGVRSHGVLIDKVNREESPNNFLSHAYLHGLFITRLHHFIRLGANGAFIVMDGGFGSLAEMMIVWQLIQVDHLPRTTPLILVGKKWRVMMEVLGPLMIEDGSATKGEVDIGIMVPSAADAVPIVLQAHERFKARMAA